MKARCVHYGECLNLPVKRIIPNWNPISSIISTGLSALAFTGSSVLAFTGKLPYSCSKAENMCFPREVMIAILLGSFSVQVFTNTIQDTMRSAQVKKYSK